MFDAWGMSLIDCTRGSSNVENVHRQLITVFGSWHTGLEMSDALLAERRHRYTSGISEARRADYPVLGHVDTWLVDHLQRLVMTNHGVQLYPNWSNTDDFVDTSEEFGTVPLHSPELVAAVDLIGVTPCTCPYASKCRCVAKLTPDQTYMCQKMRVKLPFLPVHGHDECRLFATLMLTSVIGATVDFETMALEWCKHVLVGGKASPMRQCVNPFASMCYCACH